MTAKRKPAPKVHPKVKAAAIAGAGIVGLQAALSALAALHLPGLAGAAITAAGMLLAGYAKA